jgi:hypothetical protein
MSLAPWKKVMQHPVFLQIQCISMDFLLRFLLSANDWLTVCVAIERTINVSQGVNFNKRKSKKVAKLMITVVFFGTFCSYIYDPVYRRVIDDEEAHRTWCLNEYSSFVQIFDRFLNIFHFSVPFTINGISAMMIIIVAARTRSRCQEKKTFKEHLREQLRYHKHLLISPLILVVLALPRLVLSFIQGCMGSPRESWFYIIGYSIAFIPSIMTFVVFALPSDVYMKQFTQSMKQLCHR